MQKKVRVSTYIGTFEINTTEGVKYMCELFGSTFGIGLRKPFPSIRQRESQLQSGDTVNILDVSQAGNGVKFCYDYSVCSLNVRIKYSNISVTSDPRNVNHLPQFLLLPQVPAENTNDQNLIGNQFEYQHTVYQVQSIIGQ